MHCLKKLKTTSVYNELINNYVLIVIFISLVLLIINNIFFLPLIIVFSLYLYKVSKKIVYISFGLSLIILIHLLVLKNLNPFFINDLDEVKIYDVVKNEDYQKLIVKKGLKKVIIYDSDLIEIYPGNVVKMVLEEQEILGERIEGGFDYSKYLKNNNIYKVYNLKDIEIIENRLNFNIVKYKLNDYLDNNFDEISKAFLKGLILGNKNDFDENFEKSIKENGIMHLFAISGLHVSLIIMMLEKSLRFLKIKKEETYINIFLFFYMIITNFSPSIIRAVLMYLLTLINKNKKMNLSSLDVICIVYLFLVLINPKYIYNLGFILSFLVSFFIILISPLIRDISTIKQSFYISFLSNILTLPIIINMNNEINILSPIVNVFFIYIVSTIILPFSFVSFIIPYLNNIYSLLCSVFIYLSDFSSKYFSLKIVVAEMSKLSVALFYYLVITVLFFYYNKKVFRRNIMILVLYIFLLSIVNPSFFKNEVLFLDLDDGDATLINSRSDECVALIDTGSGKNDEVTNFLKRKGIKKLDYLILTHNHDDHNGEANKIIREINVNKIVVSAYDNSVFSKTNKTIRVKKGDKIECGKISFTVFHPDRGYLDENDNSLILHTKIGKYYFLFLADATKGVEEKLLNENIIVDCIKIGHHGSTTSTSFALLERFMPRYAIIMSGRVKKFSFPRSETINTLNNYNVITYRTDLDYSIVYEFSKNKGYFRKTKKI